MTSSLARTAAAIVLMGSMALPAHAAADRLPELSQLVEAWSKITDFQAVISGHEFDGKSHEDRTFRYSYLRPNHAKVEMLDGPLRGWIVVWNGGDHVVGHGRGILSPLRKSFSLRDKMVTSLRGNTLGTPDLSPTLQCFETKANEVIQADGPLINGEATTLLVLEDKNGLKCAADPPGDFATVTKDVIYINRSTHLPMRRARYSGDMQVEEWDLNDLHINTGLSANDFT